MSSGSKTVNIKIWYTIYKVNCGFNLFQALIALLKVYFYFIFLPLINEGFFSPLSTRCFVSKKVRMPKQKEEVLICLMKMFLFWKQLIWFGFKTFSTHKSTFWRLRYNIRKNSFDAAEYLWEKFCQSTSFKYSSVICFSLNDDTTQSNKISKRTFLVHCW